MLLILSSNIDQQGADYRQLMTHLAGLPGIQMRVQVERGSEKMLTKIHLIGNTRALDIRKLRVLPCVESVAWVSEKCRMLDRLKHDQLLTHLEYNGAGFRLEFE